MHVRDGPREGALAQLPAATGCLVSATTDLTLACTVLRGPRGDPNLDVAVSPDGRFVYVAFSDGIAALQRGADGSLQQLDGLDGCLADLPDSGCEPMRGALRSGYVPELAMSPDGASLYMLVTGFNRSVLLAFARDRSSGRLQQLPARDGCLTPTGRSGCATVPALARELGALAVGPEGRTLYLAGDGALLTLKRHRGTGVVQAIAGRAGCFKRFATRNCGRVREPFDVAELVISQDRRFLYTTSTGTCPDGEETCESGALRVFGRDRGTGSLSVLRGLRGCLRERPGRGCTSGRALFWPIGAVLSPDGRNLYATADGLAAFVLDARSGGLAQLPRRRGCLAAASGCAPLRGLRSPNRMAISPDGRSVYVGAGFGDSALGAFSRNPATGTLRQFPGGQGCLSARRRAGCAVARMTANLTEPIVSPDGRYVYLSGSGMVAVFARSAGNGTR
jgi:DNA-binding beta-propeller fold protein YncE